MTFLMRPKGQGDDLLFHYTTAEGLAGILDSGELRLSTLDRMNDPRESGTYNFGWRTSLTGAFDHKLAEARTVELNDALRRTTHLASFTREGTEDSVDGYFGRGFARARNWDQYADKHRGAVLVLDRARTLAAVKALTGGNFASGPVKYKDGSLQDMPDGTWLAFDEDEFDRLGARGVAERWKVDYAESLFFTKNKDWESEDEYRILVWEDQHARIRIADLIEGIILGELHPRPEIMVLSTRLYRLGVARLLLGIMEWRHGTPGCHNSIPLNNPGSFGFEPIDDGVDQWFPHVRPLLV